MAHCSKCWEAGIEKRIDNDQEGSFYKGRWYCIDHLPAGAKYGKTVVVRREDIDAGA